MQDVIIFLAGRLKQYVLILNYYMEGRSMNNVYKRRIARDSADRFHNIIVVRFHRRAVTNTCIAVAVE